MPQVGESGSKNEAAPHESLPNRIGPYEVLSLLGVGATSRVFKAREPESGLEVAVKWLHRHASASEAVRDSLRREVEVGRSANHPGLARIHASGEEDGIPWIAMDVVHGESLQAILRQGALEWRRAADVFGQLAGIVDLLHRSGWIHRDLKPANVVVEPDGRVRLVDLGIAARAGESSGEASRGAGTPRYMSPEQVLGRGVSRASDVYSIGVCLFEAIAGRGPYEDAGEAALLAAHVNQRPRALSEFAPVPGALDAIAGVCLAKNPEHRYHSLADLAGDLEKLSSNPEIAVSETVAGRRSGLRRKRGEIPGRAAETRIITNWLARIARTDSKGEWLILEGNPGSGKSTLLEWATDRARHLAFSIETAQGSDPHRPDSAARGLLVLDSPPTSPIDVSSNVVTTAPPGWQAPGSARRTRVVEIGPLGSGTLLRWAREETGLKRIDSRDLEFLFRLTGGWPGRAEPILFRWREKLQAGEAPPPGQLESILTASPEERARSVRRLDSLPSEARLVLDISAWLDPVSVPVTRILETAGVSEDGLLETVARCLEVGIPISLTEGKLVFRDTVFPPIVREATDAALREDLISAASDLLDEASAGPSLRRRAELLDKIERRDEAIPVAWKAARALREEHLVRESAETVESWVGLSSSSKISDDALLIEQAVLELAQGAQESRAVALLEQVESRAEETVIDRFRMTRASLLARTGRPEEARSIYRGIARRAHRSKDDALRFRALSNAALMERLARRPERAERVFRALEKLSRSVEPRLRVGWLKNRAGASLERGDVHRAKADLEEAHALALAHDLFTEVVELADPRAMAAVMQNQGDEAAAILDEAIGIARRIRDLDAVAAHCQFLATIHLQYSRLEQASSVLRSAIRGAFRTKNAFFISSAYELLARIAAAKGDTGKGRRLIALARRHNPDVLNFEAYFRIAEADLDLLERKSESARVQLARADELSDSLDAEGTTFREAIGLLVRAVEGDAAGAKEGLEALRKDLSVTSFAFRIEEFLKRAE